MFADVLLWAGGILGAMVVLIGVARRPLLRYVRRKEAERALQQFKFEREMLEARFFDLARTLGKPRGLRWLDCDWQEKVTFARDSHSGWLTAFVAVNIRFEAIAGSDMEDVEAVGLIRDAAAVFHYKGAHWGTGGRALFNMNPQDAVERLRDQYLPLETA